MTKTKQTVQVHHLYSEGPMAAAPFSSWIVGDTPLICHAWSLKARLEMLDKQLKSAKPGREARDPEQDYKDSLYVYDDSDPDHLVFGFPATGIKNSLLAAAHKDKGIAKTEAMAALFLHGRMKRGVAAKAGAICDLPLVRVWAPPPQMREDMVRVGVGLNKKASLAYRGQLWPWAMCVKGLLNTSVMPMTSLAFLFREAGTSCGLGEWRNERRGSFGAFHLANREETAAWEDYVQGGPIPDPVDDPFALLVAAE